MKTLTHHFILPAVVIVLGFSAIYVLSNYLEKNRVVLPENYDDTDLAFEGRRLKGFALGAEGLLADWYWIKSLQYLGDKFVKSEMESINIEDLRNFNPRLLYPYLDNATDLDPRFMVPYSYGAVVLPAIDPEKAIALAEKGIANNPEQWRLHQHLGYIYWRLKNYEKAAEVYEKGSRITGSGDFMKMMAAAMKIQAGSRETARAMYQQMFDEATDPQTRGNAQFRLMELNSLDERDAIRSALEQSKENSGRCPQSLQEILPLLRSVKLAGGHNFKIDNANNLVDPSGAPYLLDQQICDVKLDPERTKLPQS